MPKHNRGGSAGPRSRARQDAAVSFSKLLTKNQRWDPRKAKEHKFFENAKKVKAYQRLLKRENKELEAKGLPTLPETAETVREEEKRRHIEEKKKQEEDKRAEEERMKREAEAERKHKERLAVEKQRTRKLEKRRLAKHTSTGQPVMKHRVSSLLDKLQAQAREERQAQSKTQTKSAKA